MIKHALLVLLTASFLFKFSDSYSQVYGKGTAYLAPFFNYDFAIAGYSFGAEYKKDKIGFDYVYKRFLFASLAGGGYSDNRKHQVSLKYYLTNHPDSSRKFNFYVAPILFYQKRISEGEISLYYDNYNMTEGWIRQVWKGFGGGVLIGTNKKIRKNLGIEPGISISFQHLYQYGYDLSKRNGMHIGVRVLFYRRIGKK